MTRESKIAGLVMGALLAGSLMSCHSPGVVERQQWAAALEPLVLPGTPAENRVSGYPRYRYSVVPGGVHDARDLEEITGNDRVVREHYAGINLQAVRFTRLDHDRQGYVSYRVGDRIFWTRHRVRLPRGEEILTDGIHEARVRCGNRISEVPQGPVEMAVEKRDLGEFEPPPPIAIFSARITFPALIHQILPSLEPKLPALPVLSVHDPATIDSGLLQPVPEPATFLPCVAGLSLLFLKSILTKSR